MNKLHVEITLIFFYVIFYKVNQIFAAEHQSSHLSQDTLKAQYGPIQYAGLIFRHGDRTPTTTYPTDPYKNYSWPVDFGQLLNKGKKRLYDVGEYFKHRYHHLTSKHYRPNKVIMHASDKDRCLMSSQLFFAGYFPPNGSELWNERLLWQPIPVHTTPKKYDNVIAMRKTCPRRDLAIEKFYATNPIVQTICANYSEVILYIQNHTGLNMSVCQSMLTAYSLISLQDTLLIESEHKLKLPEWTNTIFPQPLTRLRGMLAAIENEDAAIAKLNAGPLLSVIASDMLNIVGLNSTIPKYIYSSDALKTRRLHLFSGHDGTIVTLMRALKMYENVNPPYGAAFGFELRSKGISHYVTAVYEDSVDKHLQVLEIPGCTDGCTLKKFLELISSLIPQNWDWECRINETTVMPPISSTFPTTGTGLLSKLTSTKLSVHTTPSKLMNISSPLLPELTSTKLSVHTTPSKLMNISIPINIT